MTTINRRQLTKSAAWSVPAVALAAAAPAVAASTPPTYLTDLAISVTDPPVDDTTHEYVLSSPIYNWNLSSVVANASLSTSIIVTNVGAVPAVNPTGTMDLQGIDYGTDVPIANSESRKFHLVPATAGVTMVEAPPLNVAGAGRNYRWTYTGVLQPGQSIVINLKYWLESPYLHAPLQQLLSASVEDQTGGDFDDNDGRSNYLPWIRYFG